MLCSAVGTQHEMYTACSCSMLSEMEMEMRLIGAAHCCYWGLGAMQLLLTLLGPSGKAHTLICSNTTV